MVGHVFRVLWALLVWHQTLMGEGRPVKVFLGKGVVCFRRGLTNYNILVWGEGRYNGYSIWMQCKGKANGLNRLPWVQILILSLINCVIRIHLF